MSVTTRPALSPFQLYLAIVAAGLAVFAFFLPFGVTTDMVVTVWSFLPLGLCLALTFGLLVAQRGRVHPAVVGVLAIASAAALLVELNRLAEVAWGFWLVLVLCWVLAWLFAERLTAYVRAGRIAGRLALVAIPLMLGAAVLLVWEAVTRGADVPPVIMPPPSAIWVRLTENLAMLAADFQQTFLKAVLAGYVIGNAVGLGVAIAIDRSPFLKRGLLPLGNFVSALPMVGIAPIMVLWFGFDWPSKAAVVVVMTFFPMLVNTVAGLNAAGRLERDMMRTYAASYWQTLIKLRLPAAAPFIFNALKINSTLALIGAIVAEFFGTPIVGMGFRISTAVGRMDIGLVWAEIAVAAVAGTAFYAVVALIERGVTFWHPSVRGGRT
jgi:NitT/TauT family transport system permease protein